MISENMPEKGNDVFDFSYNKFDDNLLVNNKIFSNAKFSRCSINKFKEDKIFQWDSECLISTDGVILNKRHLLKENQNKNLFDLILKLKLWTL